MCPPLLIPEMPSSCNNNNSSSHSRNHASTTTATRPNATFSITNTNPSVIPNNTLDTTESNNSSIDNCCMKYDAISCCQQSVGCCMEGGGLDSNSCCIATVDVTTNQNAYGYLEDFTNKKNNTNMKITNENNNSNNPTIQNQSSRTLDSGSEGEPRVVVGRCVEVANREDMVVLYVDDGRGGFMHELLMLTFNKGLHVVYDATSKSMGGLQNAQKLLRRRWAVCDEGFLLCRLSFFCPAVL